MDHFTTYVLIAVLILCVYDKPIALTDISNTILGKGVLISIVIYFALTQGVVAGCVSALIMLTLVSSLLDKGNNTKPYKRLPNHSKIADKSLSSLVKNTLLPGMDALLPGMDASTSGMDAMLPGMDAMLPGMNIELNAVSDCDTTDVRLTDGRNKARANMNTIDSMKFSNGLTGNREEGLGFI